MNKEAAVIVGVIMAVLTLLNIALTPEDKEAVEAVVQAFILMGGVATIRQFVASKFSVRTNAGQEAERKIFRSKKR